MGEYLKLKPPKEGDKIEVSNGKLKVPDEPIVPFILGDGTGPDIWGAAMPVFEAAVKKAYQGNRRIVWFEILAGEKGFQEYKEHLPEDSLKAMAEYVVSIKGPLTTPVGGGLRSLNVTIRQALDLFACVRPVRYFKGVPSPVKATEDVDIVVFRENTEDLYAGIEWAATSQECQKVIDFLNREMGEKIRADSGIGIKPMSPYATKRLVRMAIEYALRKGRKSVTLVHKGNIMKYTEGAFRDWGYQLAREEFPELTITEEELCYKHEGVEPLGKVVVKDRITDSMFQQILLRPKEYSVLAVPNVNGDYLSDALAAQVGGLGMAPGGNISYNAAVFEATHGSAPKYAGQDKVNPSSLILSGVMMLEHIGWDEAADVIVKALERTFAKKTVTYDLERQMEGAKLLKCSEFGMAIIDNM